MFYVSHFKMRIAFSGGFLDTFELYDTINL